MPGPYVCGSSHWRSEEKALEQLDHIDPHWSYYMSQFKATSSTDAKRFEERTENEGIIGRDGSVVPAHMDIDRSDIYRTYDDPILTSPDKAIARFKHYEQLGVNHLLAMSSWGQPISQVIESMEVLAKHVLPAFHD